LCFLEGGVRVRMGGESGACGEGIASVRAGWGEGVIVEWTRAGEKGSMGEAGGVGCIGWGSGIIPPASEGGMLRDGAHHAAGTTYLESCRDSGCHGGF
jgi:hypothetical protein